MPGDPPGPPSDPHPQCHPWPGATTRPPAPFKAAPAHAPAQVLARVLQQPPVKNVAARQAGQGLAPPPWQGVHGQATRQRHGQATRQGLSCLSTKSSRRSPASSASDRGAAGTAGAAQRKQRCSRICQEPTSAPETSVYRISSEVPVSGVGECQRDADISLRKPYKRGTDTASILCTVLVSPGGRGQTESYKIHGHAETF